MMGRLESTIDGLIRELGSGPNGLLLLILAGLSLYTGAIRLANGPLMGCTYVDEGPTARTLDQRYTAQVTYFDCVLSIPAGTVIITDHHVGPLILHPKEATVSLQNAHVLVDLTWRSDHTLMIHYPACPHPLVAGWSEESVQGIWRLYGELGKTPWRDVRALSDCHKASDGN
jgi:hypothetical protein